MARDFMLCRMPTFYKGLETCNVSTKVLYWGRAVRVMDSGHDGALASCDGRIFVFGVRPVPPMLASFWCHQVCPATCDGNDAVYWVYWERSRGSRPPQCREEDLFRVASRHAAWPIGHQTDYHRGRNMIDPYVFYFDRWSRQNISEAPSYSWMDETSVVSDDVPYGWGHPQDDAEWVPRNPSYD